MNVRVLVVDDERNLVKLLRGYLEREGFEVYEALDGKAAIEVARRVDPDLAWRSCASSGSSPKPTS
jgi:DNA-binding response OmpR family regulator